MDDQRPFAIAAAQCSSVKGDLGENVRRHVSLARLAAQRGASVVVFPELSLTGYEPTIASSAALDGDEASLSPLTELVEASQLTIIAGCPIRSTQDKPFIGAVILRPGQSNAVYRKRFLGSREGQHFIASDEMMVCASHGRSIGVAICADINNPIHPADASALGATIYAAGVMMSPEFIGEAEDDMAAHAGKHRMLAVMANHASPSGPYDSARRSAIWIESGELLVRAEGDGECIVLATCTPDGWRGSVER